MSSAYSSCVYWELNVLSYRKTGGKNRTYIFNGVSTLNYNTHLDDYSKT